MRKRTPYSGLPDRQFWKNDPGLTDPQAFDPVGEFPFRIGPSDKIATAGSCFAQHVARHLRASGYNYLVTERAHPAISPAIAEEFHYGAFTARYGNVYTARQLKQLLLRAHGEFAPLAHSWPLGTEGRVVDPFRRQIQPRGFVSVAELAEDRRQHFWAVRRAIRQMDVFVFTLGLTEAWADVRDGAVFPLAPGVAGGVYEPELVQFVNFSVAETRDDLAYALDYLRRINPDAKVVLTVSPVPLNATYENRHVFVSTTWSKAVLRVCAEEMTTRFENCVYFPSYEVVTAPHVRGAYFGTDCRQVTEAGVEHVMSLFFRHLAQGTGAGPARRETAREVAAQHVKEMESVIDVLCDEERIANT